MPADQYISQVIARYNVNTAAGTPIYTAVLAVVPLLDAWAGGQKNEIFLSGSLAKNTAISGTDVDIFISLKSDTSDTLRELYNKLFARMQNHGYTPKRQNVSIGITHAGVEIDLVPGKKHLYNDDHWLYVSRSGSDRTQTNVKTHHNIVSSSGRTSEIKALKIWAINHNLDFGSLFLELVVIKALSGRYGTLSSNVWTVLQFLANNFQTTTIIDPANSANIISNDYTIQEKRVISNQASISLRQSDWGYILW